MELEKLNVEKLIANSCPIPISIPSKDIRKDGIAVKIPSVCSITCKYTCSASDNNSKLDHTHLCQYKYNYTRLKILGVDIVLFGFVSTSIKLSRKRKKEVKDCIFDENKLTEWKNNIVKIVSEMEEFLHEKMKESLETLHDVKTTISLILRNLEALIMEEKGQSIDEKIENAAPRKKALFKSVVLLDERIKLMDLISNPAAALYGQKRRTPVYKVIDKLIRIHYPTANLKNIKIIKNGSSINTPYLYDSFITVPLVLIDNAIKYSRDGQEIVVSINDTNKGGVEVTIESYSPKIYRDDIFNKNVRGNYAHQITMRGAGLGLYLARVVSEANDFEVKHRESGDSTTIDEIEYICNIFSFEVS